MRASLISLAVCAALVSAAEVKTKHLSVETGQDRGRIPAGGTVILSAEVRLPEKMHVYAPGVEQPYKPIRIEFEPTDGLRFWQPKYPPATKVHLPAIDETVPVFSGKFRIQQAVTAQAHALAGTRMIKGTLHYQTCDDRICYLPVAVPLAWKVDVVARKPSPRRPQSGTVRVR